MEESQQELSERSIFEHLDFDVKSNIQNYRQRPVLALGGFYWSGNKEDRTGASYRVKGGRMYSIGTLPNKSQITETNTLTDMVVNESRSPEAK